MAAFLTHKLTHIVINKRNQTETTNKRGMLIFRTI